MTVESEKAQVNPTLLCAETACQLQVFPCSLEGHLRLLERVTPLLIRSDFLPQILKVWEEGRLRGKGPSLAAKQAQEMKTWFNGREVLSV